MPNYNIFRKYESVICTKEITSEAQGHNQSFLILTVLTRECGRLWGREGLMWRHCCSCKSPTALRYREDGPPLDWTLSCIRVVIQQSCPLSIECFSHLHFYLFSRPFYPKWCGKVYIKSTTEDQESEEHGSTLWLSTANYCSNIL